MLHIDDIVEEISSKRQGKIDNIGGQGFPGQEIHNQWRVQFSDGTEPPLKYFTDENELRLVSCPHSESGPPGFYPSRPIMEP